MDDRLDGILLNVDNCRYATAQAGGARPREGDRPFASEPTDHQTLGVGGQEASSNGEESLEGSSGIEYLDEKVDGIPGASRADGPFDIDEVDLVADQTARMDLGSLILTPFDGLRVQFQVDEGTSEVTSVIGIWRGLGIEVALVAAPTASGGLADDLRAELIDEVERAGGTAELLQGPFGTEVRRVRPQSGPGGEQLYHVSRTWYAEGPRWLLQGTLFGDPALREPDDPGVRPFVEFFRNLVVRRDHRPIATGLLISLVKPTG